MEDMFLMGLMRGDYSREGRPMPDENKKIARDEREFKIIQPCLLIESHTTSYGNRLTTEFNFQTRQISCALVTSNANSFTIQNFSDLPRPEAITEMEEKFRALGGNPDLYKTAERKKQPLIPGKN